MSGHKSAYVTISPEEYFRLHEAERKQYFESIAFGLAQSEIVNLNRSENLISHLEDRQDRYVQEVSQLSPDIQKIEIPVSDRVVTQQIEILSAPIPIHSQEFTDTGIDDVLEKIQALEQYSFAEFDRVSGYVSDQDQIRTKGMVRAREYFEGASVLLEIIQSSFPDHLYKPGDILEIANSLQLANENLEDGLVEAAVACAQNAYLAASRLRHACDFRYLEWQLELDHLVKHLNCFIEYLDKNKFISAIEKDGQETGVQIDIDFWTNGRLSEIYHKLIDLKKYIFDQNDRISTSECFNFYHEYILPLKEDFFDCIVAGKLAALNSNLRYEIANNMMVALVVQHFHILSGGYDQGDFRGGYTATARHPSGNRVDIIIDPVSDENLSNSVHLLSLDHDHLPPEELVNRADEIRNSLILSGLKVDQFIEQKPELVLRADETQDPSIMGGLAVDPFIEQKPVFALSTHPLVKSNRVNHRR